MSVWDCFIRKSSPYYPSERPATAPFDKFFCKICGRSFDIQMAGTQSIRERSFEDQAFFKLADHLADHVYYEGKTTRLCIAGKIREKIAWKKFVKEAVAVKVCPQCGKDLFMDSDSTNGIHWYCEDKSCGFVVKCTDV